MNSKNKELDEKKIYFKKINSLLDKLDIFRLYKHLLLEVENNHFDFPSPFGLLLGQACHNEDRVIKLENIFSCAILLKMAENGDSESQFDIAQVYLMGSILPLDKDRGLFWMHEAAESGNHLALQYLESQRAGLDVGMENTENDILDSFNNLELISDVSNGVVVADKQFQLSYGNTKIKKKILCDLIDEVFDLLFITGSYLDNLIEKYSLDPLAVDDSMISKISIYNETITVRINELIFSFTDSDATKEKIYYYAKMNSLRYNTSIIKN
jgi:hypothetical protein